MNATRSTILAHIAGWLLFISLVLGFVYRELNPAGWLQTGVPASLILFFGVFVALFYLNSLLFLPKLYLRRKYLCYFILIGLLLAGVFVLRPFDRLINDVSRNNQRPAGGFRSVPEIFPDRPPDHGRPMLKNGDPGHGPGPRIAPYGRRQRADIVSIVVFVAVWSLSTAVFIIRQWRLTEQRALEAETGKVNAELSFLKAQINPHFLFNTLNNIYSLAISKSEHTAESILKLSNIMRYVTDDIADDLVPMDLEISCLQDYIDLQRLRLGRKTEVNVKMEGEWQGRKIAPLLLMTFVENAFKYGLSNHEEAHIDIRIRLETGRIVFHCRNRIFHQNRAESRTGKGISNARLRLQHLYPNRHELVITEQDGYYTVDLVVFD